MWEYYRNCLFIWSKSHYFTVEIMNRDVDRELCEDKNMEPLVHLTRITNFVIIAVKTAVYMAIRISALETLGKVHLLGLQHSLGCRHYWPARLVSLPTARTKLC